MEASATQEILGTEVNVDVETEAEVKDDFEFDREALNDLLVMKFRS